MFKALQYQSSLIISKARQIIKFNFCCTLLNKRWNYALNSRGFYILLLKYRKQNLNVIIFTLLNHRNFAIKWREYYYIQLRVLKCRNCTIPVHNYHPMYNFKFWTTLPFLKKKKKDWPLLFVIWSHKISIYTKCHVSALIALIFYHTCIFFEIVSDFVFCSFP